MINRLKPWLIPSLSDVLFIPILLYFALSPAEKLLGDGDTGYHIRAGDYILHNFTIPKADIFSYHTPAIPWTAHEWLSEVLMSVMHQAGGLTAVVTVFSIIISACALLFYRFARSEGHNIFLVILASIAFIALSQVHSLARPHIFSLIILLVWYKLLDDFQYRDIDRLNLLPFITIIWVNLHGGFIIGLTILGVYFAGNLAAYYIERSEWINSAGEKAKRTGIVLGLSILSCLINPTGYRILLFPFKLISDKFIMDSTNEFLSPNFHEFHPFKYLLLLMIIVFAYSKKKPNLVEIVLSVLFTSMSLYSIRYIPLFAVIVIPIILRYVNNDYLDHFPGIEAFFKQRTNNISAIDEMSRGAWKVLSIILVICLAVQGGITHAFNPEKKPIRAIEFLKKNPIYGNMFNDDEFGDLVIYEASQQYKVFIDGRLDMYGAGKLNEYCQMLSASLNMDELFNKYKINWCFIESDSVLARTLVRNGNWKLIYSDKIASILVKNIPLHKQLIERFPNVKLSGASAG